MNWTNGRLMKMVLDGNIKVRKLKLNIYSHSIVPGGLLV